MELLPCVKSCLSCLCDFLMPAGIILAPFYGHFEHIFLLSGSLGRLGGSVLGPGPSFWKPVAPSGTSFGIKWPTRGKSGTLCRGIFEASVAAAPKKCIKNGPWEKQQKMRSKIPTKYSFLEGRVCDPYTPAQSKCTFQISVFLRKPVAKVLQTAAQNRSKSVKKRCRDHSEPLFEGSGK